jgi:hypothetical protein
MSQDGPRVPSRSRLRSALSKFLQLFVASFKVPRKSETRWPTTETFGCLLISSQQSRNKRVQSFPEVSLTIVLSLYCY